MIKKQPSRLGLTLTEAAIVLGIAGIILGAIWASLASVNTAKMANDEITDLMTIVHNVRSLYATRQTFAETGSMTNITSSLAGADVFPPECVQSDGTIRNREGGQIVVEVVPNSPGATNAQFEVEFFGTPKTCQKLLTHMANAGEDSGPVYIYDDANGWQSAPNGALGPSSFVGCTYASFTFNLK